VTYPGVSMPRSVKGIVYGLVHHAGVPSAWLEWHGHNDFYRAVVNAATAWLYGCAATNGTLLGIGERTGNAPIEALVFECMQLRGSDGGMQPQVITEIADYFEKEIGYSIPPNQPFVGRDFNVTRAGIHADGLMKDEEIYNIFNTDAILNRPVGVAVSNTAGAAGIAHWINSNYKLVANTMIDKSHPAVARIMQWVQREYDAGRTTTISDDEMHALVKEHLPEVAARPEAG
jgi:isopropylmalate/homocitrate/citramalate synthase